MPRNERGEAEGCLGCLVVVGFIVIVAAIFTVIGSCSGGFGEDDCYTTGEPGSAQESRDIERCIKGE